MTYLRASRASGRLRLTARGMPAAGAVALLWLFQARRAGGTVLRPFWLATTRPGRCVLAGARRRQGRQRRQRPPPVRRSFLSQSEVDDSVIRAIAQLPLPNAPAYEGGQRPRKPIHLSTTGPASDRSPPWLKIQSARLKIQSARTRVVNRQFPGVRPGERQQGVAQCKRAGMQIGGW